MPLLMTVSTWTVANANWIGPLLLAATTVGLIFMGTTPSKRAAGCLVQACIFVALMKANMPSERRGDVGQFVKAVHQRLDDRLAQRLEASLADAR